MNREIKFRVWDGKKYLHNDTFCLFPDDEDGFEVRLIVPYGILEACPNAVVQQYTGLKDKNGKMIFEGDFIQYQYPTNDDCIKLKTKNIVLVRWTTEEEDNHPGFRIVDLWGQYGEMEVVGNIMENPELLKA
jgi:uncharacterized phage protein (TIGR01671 family)